MGIEAAVVAAYLESGRTAPSNDAQGKALEALACYLFDQIPGCYAEPNLISPLGAGQIDVAVGNECAPMGIPLLPSVFIVECKDWDRPVNSATLGYFLWLLASRQIDLGIFFALNGITGSPAELTAAYSLASGAAAQGKRIILITGDDLTSLDRTEQFTTLLRRRYLRAYASGGIGVGRPDADDTR